jgi:hypothetical protein
MSAQNTPNPPSGPGLALCLAAIPIPFCPLRADKGGAVIWLRGLPEKLRGLPEKLRGLPERLGGLPEELGGLPEKLRGLPEKLGGLPEELGLMPEGLGLMPEGLGLMPEGPGLMPEGLGLMPEGPGLMPEGLGMCTGELRGLPERAAGACYLAPGSGNLWFAGLLLRYQCPAECVRLRLGFRLSIAP